MQIINKTKFCDKLLDKIIEEVGLDKNVPDLLLITIDRRLKRCKGLCTVSKTRLGYSVRVSLKYEGDALTIGHELRHYQQLQEHGMRKFCSAKYRDVLEFDSVLMENYLDGEGY